MKRLGLIFAGALVLFSGCRTHEPVTIAEVDGSNDHRIFRVTGLTRLLLEPALWQLNDSHVLNFDAAQDVEALVTSICADLKMTPDEFCARYLAGPYGLHDTSFDVRTGAGDRLVAPGESFGLLTSASDVLKLGYVLLPHLDRVPEGLLTLTHLTGGNKVLYSRGSADGVFAFLGFDVTSSHVAVILRASSDGDEDEGLELLESCLPVTAGE